MTRRHVLLPRIRITFPDDVARAEPEDASTEAIDDVGHAGGTVDRVQLDPATRAELAEVGPVHPVTNASVQAAQP